MASSDVTVLLKRLDDQDQWIRELEAGNSTLVKMGVTHLYVDEAIEKVKHDLERTEQILSTGLIHAKTNLAKFNDARLKSLTAKMDVMQETVEDLPPYWDLTEKMGELTEMMQDIQLTVDEQPRQPKDLDKRMEVLSRLPMELDALEQRMSRVVDDLERRHEEEGRVTERRFEGELNRLEIRMEERIDEKHVECTDRLKVQDLGIRRLDKQLAEALEQLRGDIQKDSWTRELDRRDQVRRQELQALLQQHPDKAELDRTYTTVQTSRAIVEQLADFRLQTDKDHHSLEAALNTLERLYLRQLDSTAELVRFFLHFEFR